MSDLEKLKQEHEVLKQENETLKNQMGANHQSKLNLLSQLEAYKGELADARTISFQLRLNLNFVNNQKQEVAQKVENLEAKLEEMKNNKPAEVQPNNLESKINK